jgi:integrase
VARGSIGKRGNNYHIRYYVDGKQYWETVGPRKKDAERVLAERIRQINLGEFQILPDVTFAEFAKTWLIIKSSRVRSRTLRGYEIHLKRQLLPYFGRYKLKKISTEMVERFVADLLEVGLTPQTAAKYLGTLKQVLKQAVIFGYISRNPAEYVKPPRATSKREIQFLSPAEMQALIDAALPEHKALIATACLTGMRQGELLALSWDDVDFLNNRIHVRRAVSGRKISEPKTRHSKRVINVPPTLIEMLKEHQLRQMVELPQNPNNLVFPNQNGNLMDHSTLLRYIFWPTLKRAGLRKIRFHDLRHSFASLLIHRGENIKYIQRVLGHSSIQITLDVYGHLLPEAGVEAAERLEEFFFAER